MIETAKEAARRFAAQMEFKGYQRVALHTYDDVEGEPIYYRIRLKHPETREKWIRPMTLNGHGYELAEPEFDGGKPIYGLGRIASTPNAVVWIVEGEQKADAINKLGLVATTSGSANSATAADWYPLRGRNCIIWPDNDEPGKGYAGEVASILVGIGCTVSCLDVAALELPEKGDVVDWLAAHPGAAGDDLMALPRLAPYGAPDRAPAADSDAWPEALAEQAFYGLAGDIVREIEPETEADPAALLLQVLNAFGALVGRGRTLRH